MIVVDNLLISGNAGGERGVRGKVQAFDINTGNLQWVMYSMGPDNEVGIGPRFNTFYADDGRLARPGRRPGVVAAARVGLLHLRSGPTSSTTRPVRPGTQTTVVNGVVDLGRAAADRLRNSGAPRKWRAPRPARTIWA
jgi:hypothetical protein